MLYRSVSYRCISNPRSLPAGSLRTRLGRHLAYQRLLPPPSNQPGSRTATKASSDAPDSFPSAELGTASSGGAGSDAALERFLSWCLTNGVQGIGANDSKVCLFESGDGERGLLCVEPIPKGEALLR